MPSPFPGMNPYLERPTRWPSVHNALITDINRRLNDQLPEGYLAVMEARCYVVHRLNRREIQPDNALCPDPNRFRVARANASQKGESGAVAVQETSPMTTTLPTLVAVTYPVERTEMFINIVDADDQEQILTTIELLSPSNKMSGEGRKQYIKKQREVLASKTNLLEIDLLRAGIHTIATPEVLLRVQRDYDYAVCLSLCDQREELPTWLIRLQEPLPILPVPVDGVVVSVPLDLQAALHRCYEEHRLGGSARYDQPCEPPLSPDDAIWAENLLREQGLID